MQAILVGVLLSAGLALPSLTGASAIAATEPTLSLLTEPGAGLAPINALFARAKYSVDLVIYELADPRLEEILAGDQARGVRVRVLLDRSDEAARNATAFSYLTAHHVAVRWASDPGIDLTHEKAAVIDHTTALVMTLNFVSEDYATTRDFAVLDTNLPDVAAIDSTFSADWNSATVTPGSGTDLVWSPGAEAQIVEVIDGAHRTLLVENEEMDDPYITAPLEAAARRGVHVEIVMTTATSWRSVFTALVESGAAVHTYAESAPLYIHAKAIVADAGARDARAFVGSQNFSIASLVHNRELGIVTSVPGMVNRLASVIERDFSGGTPWRD